MSCFVVSQKHISAIMTFWQMVTHDSNMKVTTEGQMLLNENTRAYNVRYRESGEAETYKFIPDHSITPLQVIKLINCLQYNSHEDDLYTKSEAYRLSNEIMSSAARRLKGYDECKYAI